MPRIINLNDKIPGAPNFTYREFIKSNTALRRGIPNIPTDEEWVKIEKAARHIAQPVRDQFGRIRITSGFRSVELCLAIGSSKHSNHARGEALDFEPLERGVTLFEVLEWIQKNLIYRELIAEYFPNGWIHTAYRENANTKTLKLKDDKHSYSRVSIEYIKKLYDV